MKEANSTATGDARRERIKDIRERKGHLLGRGIVVSGRNPGFVPGQPIQNPLKYSVLVQHLAGVDDPGYVYKGIPETSVRQISSNESEYAQQQRRLESLESLNSYTGNEISEHLPMRDVVSQLRSILATNALFQHEQQGLIRTQMLDRYIELLRNPVTQNVDTIDELTALASEFYVPRNYEEAGRIIDAGGIVDGI